MAAARHNLSRRAVLGAGIVAPLTFGIGAAPAPAPAPTERAGGALRARRRWRAALAGFNRSAARLAAFQRQASLLPPERHAFPACEPLEERLTDLECVRLASLQRLLRLPAPDLPALALKIEVAIDESLWELADGERCLAMLKADARRLARAG